MTVTYEGATGQTRRILHDHAVLRRGLERRAGTLCEAVESGVPFERPMRILREYMTGQILPHAEAEERILHQTAATQARGSDLVRALTAEHHALAYLAIRLQAGADGSEAAPPAGRIAPPFAAHAGREEDPLLPPPPRGGADLGRAAPETGAP